MSFAIKLESQLAEFYEKISMDGGKYAQEFNRRAKSCLIRKRKLEQSRRLNVTEIILEPIEGLDSSEYDLDWTTVVPGGVNQGTVNHFEETVCRFYGDAAPKINVLESRRIFERCEKEHSNLTRID
jgi:hypothetical protein